MWRPYTPQAADTLGGVANRKLSRPSFGDAGTPIGDGALPRLLHVTPIKQRRSLDLQWYLPPLQMHHRSKPCDYVSHLLGHEGAGAASMRRAHRQPLLAPHLTSRPSPPATLRPCDPATLRPCNPAAGLQAALRAPEGRVGPLGRSTQPVAPPPVPGPQSYPLAELPPSISTPGSVLAALKEAGLADGLSAGVDTDELTSAATMICVSVDLTPQGLARLDDVVRLVFSYLGMISRLPGGPPEWVHAEMRELSALRFQYMEAEEEMDYTRRTAISMLQRGSGSEERQAVLRLPTPRRSLEPWAVAAPQEAPRNPSLRRLSIARCSTFRPPGGSRLRRP